MNSRMVHGHIGNLPAFGAVTDVSSADLTQLVGATAGLVKTLGKGALIAGGIAGASATVYRLGPSFLSILLQILTPTPKLTVPIGRVPIFVRSSGRSFWGVLLEDEVEFATGCDSLKVSFDLVRSLKICSGHFSSRCAMKIGLVDGSDFEDVRLISPKKFQFSTLAGVQTIPIFMAGDPKKPDYRNIECFEGPTMTEVRGLRTSLHAALDRNVDAIIELIGQDVLEKFFKVQAI